MLKCCPSGSSTAGECVGLPDLICHMGLHTLASSALDNITVYVLIMQPGRRGGKHGVLSNSCSCLINVFKNTEHALYLFFLFLFKLYDLRSMPATLTTTCVISWELCETEWRSVFDDWQLLQHEQPAFHSCFMCTADVLKKAAAYLPMLIHPRTITQPKAICFCSGCHIWMYATSRGIKRTLKEKNASWLTHSSLKLKANKKAVNPL